MERCPICHSLDFNSTNNSIKVDEVLVRWREKSGIAFRQKVLDQYAGASATLHVCGTCGFGMFLPALPGTPEFYADVTQKDYYNADKWEFWHALADIARFESPHLLEVGCGEGQFLDFVRSQLPNVTTYGYDINPGAAVVAGLKKHTVFTGDLKDVFPKIEQEKGFDIICLFQLLEHLADPVGFLKDLNLLLKPEGVILIGVPDIEGPIRHFPNSLTELPPHHLTQWRASTFHLGMQRIGYTVERIDLEPLPDYLWHTYLPEMWHEDIWPAELSRRMPPSARLEDVTQAVLQFIDHMSCHGVKWLYGVPGHTLYVVLRKEDIKDTTEFSRAPQIRKTIDGERWSLPQILGILTGLTSSPLNVEEEAWFRQIRAATLMAEGYEAVEAVLQKRETAMADRETAMADREAAMAAREADVAIREAVMANRESAMLSRESALLGRESTIANRINRKLKRMFKG